jgi:DNA-binding transcriptional MerR regulator
MPGPEGKPEGKLVATREVLGRAGISRQVLYRYMQLGLVVPARTTGTGRNYFSPRIFRILQLIELLQEHGYTLRDIKDIVGRRMASRQSGAD